MQGGTPTTTATVIPNIPASAFTRVFPTFDIVGFQQLGPPTNGNADIAKRGGVTRQTIYAIEAGNYVPNTEVALKLAREPEVVLQRAALRRKLEMLAGYDTRNTGARIA